MFPQYSFSTTESIKDEVSISLKELSWCPHVKIIEEQNMLQAIITAGEDLIHVQVSENYRGTPGTGTTNWNDIKMGLQQINYQGNIVIESFTPDNKNLAEAVCIWKPLAESQDKFAQDGLKFLKNLFD